LLAEPAALPSSQEMKVSMVNFSGSAPEPVEGAGADAGGDATGAVPLEGVDGVATGVSTATGDADASATEDSTGLATGLATGTVELAGAGVEGTDGAGAELPEPPQVATGPPGAL
jgi:hypothetical protein